MTDGPAARDLKGNPFAIAGLAVAAVAMLIGVFSFRASLVVGVVALILSGIGFAVYRARRIGRLPAAAGLVIGGIAVVLSVFFVAAGL